MTLNVKANIEDPDGFYQQITDMQRDLSDEEIQMMNAKLILILSNHIGDAAVLKKAIKIAAS